MKTIFIIFILSAFCQEQLKNSEPCECYQLIEEMDCQNAGIRCYWNGNLKQCTFKEAVNQDIVKDAYFCYATTQNECLSSVKLDACQWVDNICSHFSGCSAFQKSSDQECQGISKKCFSNGINCFERSDCSSYTNDISCFIDSEGHYCVWEKESQVCHKAENCDQLPLLLNTDELCRKQNNQCTTKLGGGCVKSGLNCADQQLEIQCKNNLNLTQKCFWDGLQCKEKNCDNAPKTYQKDQECKTFLSLCTTKKNGGCMMRSKCEDSQVEQACNIDDQGNDCYWNETSCVNKVCENAPSYFSNQQCISFKLNCLGKLGGGCQTNTSCENINLKDACIFDNEGFECIFDGKCRKKICTDAPLTVISNTECQNFVKGSFCVVKTDGGCYEVKTCSDIQNEIGCIRDIQGNPCIWDTDLGCRPKSCSLFVEKDQCTTMSLPELNCIWKGQCFQKECAFAPKSLSTHEQCQEYSELCTLNQSGKGCSQIPLVCEAHLSELQCIVRGSKNINQDFTTYPCGWADGKCQDKSCKTAPIKYSTNIECQSYLPQCIIKNPINGIIQGCMDNLECKNKRVEQNCKVYTQNGQECVWNQNTQICEEKDCSKAYLELNTFTNETCQDFSIKLSCIANNSGLNCMDKKQTCQELVQDNCDSTLGGSQCYWDGNKCVDFLCENLNPTECNQLENCVVNDSLSKCQNFQENCYQYGKKENCLKNSKMEECIWDLKLNKCRDAQCTDAPTPHILFFQRDICKNFKTSFGECEVHPRFGSAGCAKKKKNCSDYPTQRECHSTEDNIYDPHGFDDCTWKDNKCQIIEEFPNYFARENAIDDPQTCEYFDDLAVFDNGGATRQCRMPLQNCEDYKSEIECSESRYDSCYFDGSQCKAIDNETDCSYFTGNHQICQYMKFACTGDLYRTDQKCVQKDCSVFSGEFSYCLYIMGCAQSNRIDECSPRQDQCDLYLNAHQCVQIAEDKFCVWKDDKCQDWDNQCESIFIMNDLDICLFYSSECIYQKDGERCQQIQNECKDYVNEINCSSSITQEYCVWKITPQAGCYKVSEPSDCYLIKRKHLTNADCYRAYKKCQLNKSKNSCYPFKHSCSEYTDPEECNSNSVDICTLDKRSDGTTYCTVVGFDLSCDQIYLGQDKYSCEYFDCVPNGQYYCREPTCADFSAKSWKCEENQCVYIATIETCIDIKPLCSDYTRGQECVNSNQGKCVFSNSRCTLRKDCSQADQYQYFTHEQCLAFLDTCTIAPSGGCQKIQPCQERFIKNFCLYHKDQCYWNEIEGNCVERECSNYEKNQSFDTPEECQLLNCEISANGLGCQSRVECFQYNKLQCSNQSKNSQNIICGWNTNKGVCEIKTCSTVPNTFNSHSECNDYLKTCTVNITISPDSSLTTSGCIQLSQCKNYVSEVQCKINTDQQKCGWNGKSCDDYSCLTAPKNEDYSTHDACLNYLQGCTLDSSGFGCVQIPDTCEELSIQEQCQTNNSGKPCIWLEETGNCVGKQCYHAPIDLYKTQNQCELYLPECTTYESEFCQILQCEDFRQMTEEECNNAMIGCTTDGIKCVLKHELCEGALDQRACTKNKKGELCDWVTNLDPPHCVLKTCQTASSDLKTEVECQNYLQGCTPQIYGGCKQKLLCSDVDIKAACTKSNSGKKCSWDDNQCRNFDCQDLSGVTHSSCKKLQSNCTVGLSGKCARMQNCEQTLIQDACIEGLDGPCLWIASVKNETGTYGACFQYSSCKSISWTTDEQCKLISPLCTTNGQSCVSISNCSENNQQGCKTGYDGDCILIDNNCKKFENCQEAKYLTHVECQKASYKCTSDGISSCIQLDQCQNYLTKESCVINIQGKIVKDQQIISTGICVWNESEIKCRDQTCQDFTYSTHQECNQILSLCTSNGTKCVVQENCKNYTDEQSCRKQLGKDGSCVWDKTICRIFQCEDIINGITNQNCQQIRNDCFSNGQKCMLKKKCNDYTSDSDCHIGGLDGYCYWGLNGCQLIIQCSDSNTDSIACQQVTDKCFWDKDQKTCLPHSCDTFYSQNKLCKSIYNIKESQVNFCKLDQNNKCKSINPNQFSSFECFTQSNEKYHWNGSKCEVCHDSSKEGIEASKVNNFFTNYSISISSDHSKLFYLGIIMINLIL